VNAVALGPAWVHSVVSQQLTMRPVTLTVFVLLSCLIGCAHDQYGRGKYIRGHGDPGQFIIQRAIEYFGVPSPTNALPAIGGRWRFSEEDDDVLVILEQDRYPSVAALLRAAFGEPSFGPVDTIDGHKLASYRLTTRGGGIMLTSTDAHTEVIIVRPQKQER
jgi:hypothetical protein